jgi:hypothetical protein
MDQVTAVLADPVTLAAKELDAPGFRVTVEGTTETLTLGATVAGLDGVNIIEELAVSEEFVWLVAISVTDVWAVIDAGAL